MAEIIYGSEEHPVPEGPLQRIIEFVGGYATAGIWQVGIPASPSGLYGTAVANKIETTDPDEETGEVDVGYPVGYGGGQTFFGEVNHKRCSPDPFDSGGLGAEINERTVRYLPTPEIWAEINMWYFGIGTETFGTKRHTILLNFERMRKRYGYNAKKKVPLEFGSYNIGIGNAGFRFKCWRGAGFWQVVGDDDVQWTSDSDVPVRLLHRKMLPNTLLPTVKIEYNMRKEATYTPPVEEAGGEEPSGP